MEGSWATVQLYRETENQSTSFILAFTPKNELADIYYPTQYDAEVALQVAQEFIDAGELNEQETLLAKHVEDLLFSLCFDAAVEFGDDEPAQDVVFQQLDSEFVDEFGDSHFGGATGDVEIADIIRELTDDVLEDDEEHTREFGAAVGTDGGITIISHDSVTAPNDESLTVKARDLRIVYTDYANNITYVYNHNVEGERTLEIVYGDDLSEEDTKEKPETEEHEGNKRPALWSEHVNVFLDALASVTTENLDPTDLL